jgi:hypothetical protein
VLLAVAGAAITASGIQSHEQGNDRKDDDERAGQKWYAIGLWGDLPYSDLQALTGVPNLIKDMNAQDLEFTVHDGDFKGGNGTPGSVTPTICSDAMYLQGLSYLNALEAPAMFTPGDNDWTDCDRPSNGGFSSLERLDFERALFFNTRFSLGQHRMRQEVQTASACLGVNGLVPCVENRRWTVKGVTYLTLNVQGSCNNLCDTAPSSTEWEIRNGANITWLRESFEDGTRRGSSAIMIIAQGNPGWDQSDVSRTYLRDPKSLAQTDGQPDGYQHYLRALREAVVAFRRPVAYVHGDSHYFRVDKPLLDELGRRLENFTRVETFGDNQGNGNNDAQWLKVFVDPRSREVFAFQPQIVPANRTAVPLS